MNIKQDPANPCLLREVCPDGSLGCIVYDGSLCTPNPAPGSGFTPPAPGGNCAPFKIDFAGSTTTPLPFIVNAGDTINVTTLTGAGSTDGLTWYCPDGSIFFLGACTGPGATQSGDPLNTKNHMSILFKIGSSYYSATSGIFTVPSGVANAQVYLQVNNPTLTSVQGKYHAEGTYCNNAAVPTGPGQLIFDFTTAPHSFIPDPAITDIVSAVWLGGKGWALSSNPPAGTWHLDLERFFSNPTTINRVRLVLNNPNGYDFPTLVSFGTYSNDLDNGGSTLATLDTGLQSVAVTTATRLDFHCHGFPGGLPQGTFWFSKLIVDYTGAVPFT